MPSPDEFDGVFTTVPYLAKSWHNIVSVASAREIIDSGGAPSQNSSFAVVTRLGFHVPAYILIGILDSHTGEVVRGLSPEQ